MTSQSNAKQERKAAADYGFARTRDLAFDAVNVLWRKRKSAGMKKTDIAEKLGRDPAWVNRALRGPGNWTLRTFGELVEALDGEMEIIVHDLTESSVTSANYDAYLEYTPAVSKIVPIFGQANTVPLMVKAKPITNDTVLSGTK